MRNQFSSDRIEYTGVKVSLEWLTVGLLVGAIAFFVVKSSMERVKTPYFETQLRAANLMNEATRVLAAYRLSLGIEIDPSLDPNRTGLIGPEFTELTTTLGNIEAKRTSTNPDFAALMVKYFEELDLKKDAHVAIGASGSFPALILATLCACEVMDLQPLLSYSIGASEHGATHPDFTFVQMLQRLVDAGLLRDSLVAVSLGGNNDNAGGMFFPNALEIMTDIASSSGKKFILEDTLQASIQARLKLYSSYTGGLPSVFVNVGGASANFGESPAALSLDNGLLKTVQAIPEGPDRGLIYEYASLGVPIIHLLNIRDLALKNGIPVDPVPLPEPGSSGVYYIDSYSMPLTLLFITLMISILAIARLRVKK